MSEQHRSKRSREETYNAEMQNWMARQSFWYRISHRRANPDSRPILLTLLILLGWLVPIAGGAAFVYFLMAQKYLSSGKFSTLIAWEIGEILGLRNTKILNGQWKADAVTLSYISGEGAPDQWLRKLEVGSARFNLTIRDMLQNSWTPEHVTIQDVKLDIRGGRLDAKEIQRVLAEDIPVAKPEGLSFPGINPNAKSFRANRIVSRNTNIIWGTDESSSIRIASAAMEATRLDDSTWSVQFTDGTISCAWLKNAHIDDISFTLSGESLDITSAKISIKSPDGSQEKDSAGIGSGRIDIATEPNVMLKIDFSSLSVNHLVTQEYHRVFSGYLSGPIEIKGTTARQNGLHSDGKLELVPGFTFGVGAGEFFPVLEVLGSEIVDMPLRHIETAKGSLRFVLDNKELNSPGLVLEGESGGRIEGTFKLALDTKEIDGVFRVGITPSSFDAHPLLRERFFREEGANLLWATLPFKGPINGATTEIAEKMRATIKEQSEAKTRRP